MSKARLQPQLRICSGGSDIRTLADGLDQLRRLEPTLGARIIILKVSRLRLPTGEMTASIALTIPRIAARTTLAFMLPASAHFYATTAFDLRQPYDTVRLNGAVVDIDGNVRLQNGIHLHNIELMPTTLRRELTWRQEKILFVVVDRVLQARDRCLRTAHPSLGDQCDFDYGALPNEKLPILKNLERQIQKWMPDATRREIASTLATAGMRQPRSGRHANIGQSVAS